MKKRKPSQLKQSAHAGAATLAAGATESFAHTPSGAQKFLLLGPVGSENLTRANFPFVWAAALREAGNEVRIEIVGDATVLLRNAVSNRITPVGWPPFKEASARAMALKIPIYV